MKTNEPLTDSHSTLIIIGASVRAAAQSALRAGYRVHALDLFADSDLAACATTTCVAGADYPQRLTELLGSCSPQIPWMYTGGLENHADIIDAISQQRHLWGNSATVIRQTRDAVTLAQVARQAGWMVPPEKLTLCQSDVAGWLFKPYQQCGGFGIHRTPCGAPPSRAGRYQKRVYGPSYSGAFVADGRQARLIGISKQILAEEEPSCSIRQEHPFAYVGSIAPWWLPAADRARWQQLADALMQVVPMVGLFGVDAVYHPPTGDWYLIEINPRWTASMELYERTAKGSLLALHAAACNHATANEPFHPKTQRGLTLWEEGQTPLGTKPFPFSFCSKRVVYAPADTVVNWLDWNLRGYRPNVEQQLLAADLPHDGQLIRKGHPVLTVFGYGATWQHAERQARAQMAVFLQAITAGRPCQPSAV